MDAQQIRTQSLEEACLAREMRSAERAMMDREAESTGLRQLLDLAGAGDEVLQQPSGDDPEASGGVGWPSDGEHGVAWDVFNASVAGLVNLCAQLTLYRHLGEPLNVDPAGADSRLEARIEHDVRGWLRIAERIATDFEAIRAQSRIKAFGRKISKGMTWRELAVESQMLLEALADDLSVQAIYRYPAERLEFSRRQKSEWEELLKHFPSAREDARSALDCFSLGHYTASVFHSMRVLEFGLASLAEDLNVTVGVNTWHTVIDQIEARIRQQRNDLPRGEDKNARLEFLSAAANEFRYFKDGWRNHVSHNRAHYGEHQARVVLEHVRTFMATLSRELFEAQPPE